MLQKQNIPINFAQGLDTKTDKFQVALGKFLRLQNTIFDKGGQLQKRNGYGSLASLPDATSTFVSTFNGNLTAVGSAFNAYSAASEQWVNKGTFKPLDLDTLALIRSNTQQTYADSALSESGLICTVYTDNIPDGAGATNPSYRYVIADSTTGQNIVAPTIITSTGPVTYAPKVFTLDRYFIIVFNAVISAANHLQFIAINTAVPTSATTAADISTAYTAASTGTFDGVVANGRLYLAWNGNDGGGAIRMTYLTDTLSQGNTVTFAGESCTHMSVTADITQGSPIIWASYYKTGTTSGKSLAVDQQLTTVLAPTAMITATTVTNITSTAQSGVLTIYYQVTNTYSYDSGTRTDYIKKRTLTQAGVAGTAAVMARSVGLASKAFLVGTTAYMLTIYSSINQPTYFLLDSSGNVTAKLAYSNGSSYYTTGLPNASIKNSVVSIPYLFKDLVTAVNKTQGLTAPNGVYTQTGINICNFNFAPDAVTASEIGQNLNVAGGFLWAYDGYVPVEQGFNLWPDSVEFTTSTTGGFLTDQQYFYQALYEWTDNQGNIHRSAPSIPIAVTTTGGNTSSNTIYVPTLRLTYKTANPVKIVIFRWSVAQQTYYQVTSVSVPIYNSTTADSITFVDTLADSSIIGNSILYTTGGVIEDIGPPATSIMALWQSRLFLVDSEDRNLIWFSKQVIEGTPVEMSDLFTIFVPPTTAAQGSTGPVTALFAMDDKLIIFKKNAIYYVTGVGPDNTGANNQFSEPTFITSTVGCDNPRSLVFIPQGIMFQSDKGIWLLDRNLQTSYIGAAVQDFTLNASAQSAVNVPGTNQVRFTIDSGFTLMYDYYYAQWGAFVNVPAVSSTIYQDLHTYINSAGQVFQETPGRYLDGSRPVLISFTTSWLNLAGLQGYQRAYEFYLLGVFKSPHKLALNIAYDYNSSSTQSTLITPDNYSGNYGYGNPATNPGFYGNGSYGGSNIEWWRVFLETQKCSAFQISLDEVFDDSYGVSPGAGFTMSGIDLTVGVKKGRPSLTAARQAG